MLYLIDVIHMIQYLHLQLCYLITYQIEHLRLLFYWPKQILYLNIQIFGNLHQSLDIWLYGVGARHAFIFIRECAIFYAFYNSLV